MLNVTDIKSGWMEMQAERNFVGYNRYDWEEKLAIRNELYGHLRLYLNFFHSPMKLISKERIGTKVKKQYDVPQTPFQRLLDLEEVSVERRARLQADYDKLNPAYQPCTVKALFFG